MDSPSRVISIDWISRLLAFISILAAAFAIAVHFTSEKENAYTNTDANLTEAVNKILQDGGYVDSSKIRTEVQSVLDGTSSGDVSETVKEQIRLVVAAELDKRDDPSNETIKTRLNDFQEDADNVIDKWEDNLSQFFVSAENEFKRIKEDGVVALRPKNTDPFKDDEDQSGKIEPTPAEATFVTRVTMKPVLRNARVVRIANDSDTSIQITRVSFKPKTEYQKAFAATKTSSDVKTLVFKPEHNTATEPEAHATYVMPLDDPIEIAAEDVVYVQCQIENPIHHRYMFVGTLKIEYDDGSTQDASNVKVDFTK